MSPVAIFGHIHVTTTFWALGHDPDVWKVWGQGWEKKKIRGQESIAFTGYLIGM